jgi:hypothetical protein
MTLLAIVFSAALLILIGVRDPKRLRSARHGARNTVAAAPLSAAMRHLFGWLSLAPGVALAAIGQWWGFLIWLGAITAIGWTIAITAGYAASAAAPQSRS